MRVAFEKPLPASLGEEGGLPLVIGHVRVQEALKASVGPVTLFTGPSGVGKRRLCSLAASLVGAQPSERYVVDESRSMESGSAGLYVSVDRVREILRVRPRGPRVVQCDVSKLTPSQVNSLLKVLEEPPAQHYFLLYSHRPVLDTVVSRSTHYRVGYLTDEEVEEVVSRLGVRADLVAAAVRLGRGSVEQALEVEQVASAKRGVVSAFHAAYAQAPKTLSEVCHGFTAEDVRYLRVWAMEALSSYRVFGPEDSFFALSREPELPRRVEHLTRSLRVPPRLLATEVFLPLLVHTRKVRPPEEWTPGRRGGLRSGSRGGA